MTIDLPFPRGFVLSLSSSTLPETFVPGPIPGLFTSPDTLVAYAESDEAQFVVILGTCVNVGPAPGEASRVLLEALCGDENQLLEALGYMAGRYAIIYSDGFAAVKVVTDATAMRTVFYSCTGGVVASHAILVERALGGAIERSDMPFRYGYPGNRTPYSRTRLLTPNVVYKVDSNELGRFWPRGPVAERTAESVAREVLDRATMAVQHIAAQMPIKLALTAGLDSRAMLAVVLNSGIEFETYTYGMGEDTRIDQLVAAALAERFGIAHTPIPMRRPSQELQERMDEAHYAVHHKAAVRSLSEWMGSRQVAVITANLLEIGRAFYQKQKRAGAAAPATAESMASLHYRATPRSTRDLIDAWGKEQYDQATLRAFDQMIEETDYVAATEWVDPFDLFYWEHRMSAWHGASMLERDFYAEPFIPFNARTIFEAMLGVPGEQRNTADVLYELVGLVEPRLLEFPINPRQWPPER